MRVETAYQDLILNGTCTMLILIIVRDGTGHKEICALESRPDPRDHWGSRLSSCIVSECGSFRGFRFKLGDKISNVCHYLSHNYMPLTITSSNYLGKIVLIPVQIFES